jgi:hypothetical protein
MNAFIKSAFAVVLIALGTAFAQTAPTLSAEVAPATADTPELAAKKAAAQTMLEQDIVIKWTPKNFEPGKPLVVIKITASSKNGAYHSTQSFDLCGKGNLPAKFEINSEGNIVFTATPIIGGACPNIMFVVNPLTKDIQRYVLNDGKKSRQFGQYELTN